MIKPNKPFQRMATAAAEFSVFKNPWNVVELKMGTSGAAAVAQSINRQAL